MSTCGAKVVNIRLRHEGGNICLCICVLVVYVLCVRSGLRLRLTHHLSRPPPHTMLLPVEDAAGALVISRAGAGCSGERRPTLGGRWRGLPYWPCWAPIGGWGAFGSPGPGPGPPWCGRLPVEPAACRHGHPGAAYTVAAEVPALRALLCPFWVEAAVVPAVVLLGVPCPGGPRMFGARVFSVPASCLAGWGCCSPHTLVNVTWRNLMNTSALTHTGVHSSIHIGCKNRCSQTPLS